MIKTLIILTLTIASISTHHRDYLPTFLDGAYFNSLEYLQKSASEKMDEIWEAVLKNPTPMNYFSKLQIAKILIQDLKPTFEHYGDVIPGFRKKLIHTRGTIAKVSLSIVEDSPYTGFLKEGTNNMLIRLSCASEYDVSKSTPEGAHNNFVPGISAKIFIDGDFSVNTVMMKSLSGQSSWDFFDQDFTNSFENDPNLTTDKKLLVKRFSMLQKEVSTVGISDFARFVESGYEIPNPKYPFRLEISPTEEVKGLFSDHYTEDFTEILKRIPAGTVIYKLYAYERPDCERELIGEIKTISDMVTSSFADEFLFFRHQYAEEDDSGSHKKYNKYRYSTCVLGDSEQEIPEVISKCPFGYGNNGNQNGNNQSFYY